MKLIIDVPKEEFENLKNSTRPMYWSEHLIKNGTPISDNATNEIETIIRRYTDEQTN